MHQIHTEPATIQDQRTTISRLQSTLESQQEKHLQQLAHAQKKQDDSLLTLRNKHERQLHDAVVSAQEEVKCLQREHEDALRVQYERLLAA